MAVIPKSEMVRAGKNPIPLNVYTIRCVKAEYKTAQPTTEKPEPKPTLRTTWEIIDPPQVTVNGETYDILGQKFFMAAQNVDPSNPNGLGVVQQALERGDFDFTKFNPQGDLDTDRLPIALLGWCVRCELQSKEDFAKLSDGTVIKDSRGNAFSRGHVVNPWFSNIIAPADEQIPWS